MEENINSNLKFEPVNISDNKILGYVLTWLDDDGISFLKSELNTDNIYVSMCSGLSYNYSNLSIDIILEKSNHGTYECSGSTNNINKMTENILAEIIVFNSLIHVGVINNKDLNVEELTYEILSKIEGRVDNLINKEMLNIKIEYKEDN